MSEIILDCKKLPCPQPVLKCKGAIDKNAPAKLTVVVDNDPAKENVSRFLQTQGYEVTVSPTNGGYELKGVKSTDSEDSCDECAILSDAEIKQVSNTKILVFIAADKMGDGDDELGSKLMLAFLSTLKEMGDDLWRIVMVNGGVKLSTPDNPCMEKLKELESQGISILVCGTCLEHFGLTKTKAVGETTNMLDIITSFQLATKTIRV